MTFPTSPAPDRYGYFTLYAVQPNGELRWQKKDPGGSQPFHGPTTVGSGWAGFVDVIPAGGNRLYALERDGTLLWYQHDGFSDGTFSWTGPKQVGNGWRFAKIFGGGDGVVYAIRDDGTLVWYRHYGFTYGGDVTTWADPREIGTGWSEFVHVCCNGHGLIYAVHPNGDLVLYSHLGFADGSPTWTGPRLVSNIGPLWAGFVRIIPTGNGVLLTIAVGGELLAWRDNGLVQGEPTNVDGPVQIGVGWRQYVHVFALLPSDPEAPR